MKKEKYEVISEIIRLYDEVEELKVKNNHINNPQSIITTNAELSCLELKILEYGKEKMFDEVCSKYSRSVRVDRNEETDELKAQTYGSWFSSAIRYSEIPDNISRQEIKDYFSEKFMETYEANRKKAIENLKIEEND